MIKNNLNIAQQVNCSGISSSLFLFFDSKILCSGYLIQESHWGGGPGPSSSSLCGLYHNRGQGDTIRCHFYLSHICCKANSCVLWGRAAWQFPFPTKLFRIKKEKQNKGNAQPSPSHQNWVKYKEGEVETRACLVTATNQVGLITNPCVFRVRLTFWKSPKKSSLLKL